MILGAVFADRTEITKEMEMSNACMVAFLTLLPVWAGDFDIMGLNILCLEWLITRAVIMLPPDRFFSISI